MILLRWSVYKRVYFSPNSEDTIKKAFIWMDTVYIRIHYSFNIGLSLCPDWKLKSAHVFLGTETNIKRIWINISSENCLKPGRNRFAWHRDQDHMCSMSHGDSLILKTNHSYCNIIKHNVFHIVKIQYSKNIKSSLYYHHPFIFKSMHCILLLNKITPPPSSTFTLFMYFINFSVNSTLCVNKVLELSLFPIFSPMKPKYFCNQSD